MTLDSTLVVEGLPTRVRVAGEGPALLLIGGLWTQAPMFDPLRPLLDGFRTIAFDPPGIGETALPEHPYSIPRLARFTAGILEALDVDRAHVLGVSLGGAVAQQLARSHPDRVERLVLVSTGPGAFGVPGRPDVLLRFGHPTAYRDVGALERSAGAIFGGRLRQHPELVRAWHLRPPTDRRAWLFRLAGTAGWTSLPWLHHVTQPTLVLHGDDDPIVPAVNARLIAWRLPRAHLEVVEGGGHLLLLDSAADVIPLITEFLTRTPTDRPAHERGRLQ